MERGPGERTASALFAGFRALGLFSSDIPHAVRFSALKRRFYVTTCVGKSFHTYDVSAPGSRRPPPGPSVCGPRVPSACDEPRRWSGWGRSQRTSQFSGRVVRNKCGVGNCSPAPF